MGCPLLPNPFWTAHILPARDIQGKIQAAQGIRDALDIIRREQQERAAGFRLLEQITQNMLSNPGPESSNLGTTPANSPATDMPPPREDRPLA